jgi:serine/threonine protein phosphatase PrpC
VQAGTELAGRYVLVELLGRGGMGEVWRATDQVLGRLVAVKVISEWHADPELASRLKREAKIAASLQHPGIIVVHDVGSVDDRPFIVMELLHGRDLASALKLSPDGLPVDTVISLGIQAADAVQAAHAGHVVHRDLKPANLFLQESGTLKICDFGIARAAEATSGLTAAGRAIGTVSYMSPEQCEGKQVDERSDLYSLGCVLYELLTGEPPFRAEWPAIMYQHVMKAPPSPRTLRPDIPVQLDQLILELLAKNPDDRPASAGRVAAAVRAIQQRRPSPAQQRAPARNQVVRLPSRPAITTGLAFRYAVRSDPGLRREGNEDSAYAGPRLLAVADGIGGHAAGEVASALAIASMAQLDAGQPRGDMREALAMAVVAANARLQEKIIADPAVEGMGTTLTALLWDDGRAAVCHIGQTRGYLLRDGELYQITHDHTQVQSLVDEGRIGADDVATHLQRSVLLRVLDGRSVAEPDLSVHESLPGDRYLLCSDGLSGVVSNETLLATLADIDDPEAATGQLIELAIAGGGPDNITCIVADVVDTATTRLPLTTMPVLAGAAAAAASDLRLADGGGPLRLREPPRGRHTDRMDRAAARERLRSRRPQRPAPVRIGP